MYHEHFIAVNLISVLFAGILVTWCLQAHLKKIDILLQKLSFKQKKKFQLKKINLFIFLEIYILKIR